MNKNKYIQLYDRQITKQERLMASAMNKEIRRFIDRYAFLLQSTAVPLIEEVIILEHEQNIERILNKSYRNIINYFYKLNLEFLKDFEKKENLINRVDIYASVYATQKALKKAKGIAATTIGKIRKKIDAAITEGLGIPEIATLIRTVKKVSKARAVLIARTEVNASANYASLQSAKDVNRELGIPIDKEWVAVNDDRTRDTHSALDGVVVGFDENFDVNGYQAPAPHSDSLPAEELINCRCRIIVVPKL